MKWLTDTSLLVSVILEQTIHIVLPGELGLKIFEMCFSNCLVFAVFPDFARP